MSDVLIVLILVLVVVIILRGPSTLPRLGEALGQSVRSIRRAVRDDDDPPRRTDEPPV